MPTDGDDDDGGDGRQFVKLEIQISIIWKENN